MTTTCPLCQKEFKRLDLHIGTAHTKEVLQHFGGMQTNETTTQGNADTHNTRPNANPVLSVNDSNKSVPVVVDNFSAIKQMYKEMNEMLMLQVMNKELQQTLRGENTKKNEPFGINDFLKLQQQISEQEKNKFEEWKKLTALNGEDDDDAIKTFLTAIAGGMQNAQHQPVDTTNQQNGTETRQDNATTRE